MDNRKKRNIKKIIKIALIGSGVVFLCMFIYVIAGLFAPPVTEERINEMFEEDKELLIQVAEYLEEDKVYGIRIRGRHYEKGYMEVYYLPEHPYFVTKEAMNNPEIEDIVDTLLHKKGYTDISKNGNSIFFHVSGDGVIFNSIAYSIDGEGLTNEFETTASLEYSKLSGEDMWYYAEQDFDAVD